MKKIIIGMLLTALLMLAGCQNIAGEENTIHVTGTSELSFDPDEAEVWAGIDVLEINAEKAQEEANRVMNNIIDGLRYKGITEEDMETERLSLREEKVWEDGEYVSKGYRATQTLKITVDDLDKVGEVVDVAVANGANTINRINFKLSEKKEQEYKQQALAEATANAKQKAEVIADSLGVELKGVKTVTESDYNYRPYGYAMEKAVGAAAVEEATAVMPGDVEVNGRISVIYNIR
ncbi:DUF541 domain-containing protein [Candidatus Woesearchaeota archaeon]|nr:DUF541 domain-containing protein [Candidatus Woesearchaeota archaeon]